jgi:hypothetical protein
MLPRLDSEMHRRALSAGAVGVTLVVVGACGSSSRSETPTPSSTGGMAVTAGGSSGRGGSSGGGSAGAKGGQAGVSNSGTGGASGAGMGAGGTAGRGMAGSGADGGTPAAAGRSAAGEGGAASGSGGSAGEPSTSPLDAYVQAFCETARTCCEAASMPLGPLEACETAFRGQTNVFELLEKGTVTLDEAKLSACVAAYATAGDSCEWTAVHAACHGIVVGTLADGEPCTDAFECDRSAGPKYCLKLQDASNPDVGTCVSPPRASADDPCIGTCAPDTDCSSTASSPDASVPTALCYEADGLFCRYGYGCQALVDDGETCDSGDVCGSDGQCLSTCQPRAAEGEECIAIFDCAKNLTCDAGHCAPEPVASSYTCSGHPPFVN